MRVLLFHDIAEEIGGAETYVNRLLGALNAEGHPSRLITISSKPPAVVPERANVVVFREPSSKAIRFMMKAKWNPWLFVFLCRQIHSFKPNVLHLHHNYKYPSTVLLAAALKGVPVVQTVHDYGFLCPTIWHVKPGGKACCTKFGWECVQSGCIPLSKYLLELAYRPIKHILEKMVVRKIICPSKKLQDCISQQGFRTELVRYFIGCPQKMPKKRPGTAETILYVGGLTPQKGVHVLLPAFASAMKKFPKARLVVVGEGTYRGWLESMAGELDISRFVHFAGKVPNSKIGGYYANAGIVAVPSIWEEQFGLVGIEAMSYGVPVVGSDIGGIPEWLEDGKTGLLAAPGDSKDLAAKIIELMKKPARAKAMGERGRKTALVKYCSSEKHASRMVQVYKSVQ
ncbi:MAG: glycosyltransferase [Candidatus Micrarchaeia archaeon]|jgi:glycosyltransferase involved in cell wall biosynthesis